MGRLLDPSQRVDCDLCREQGGTSVPVDRKTRVGGAAGDNHWPVSEADKLLHRQSAGAVLDLEGRSYLTGGEGGGSEEGGGGKAGQGAEGGAQSAVDGKCARAGLGKKGQMPHYDLVLDDDIILVV